ncbi:hypothetical protein ACFUIY_05700 [Streptomyces griseorubiginosus]|uniref:hypothetical protein n=1 Tax=Streptomyces griseorubiginosus TaxID=67304 RepID=UPI00362D97BE
MANTNPLPRQRRALTKSPPPSALDSPWRSLARDLIGDDLRATSSTRELADALAHLWRRLTGRGATGRAAPSYGGGTGGGGGGGASEMFDEAASSAGDTVARLPDLTPAQHHMNQLSVEDLQKVTHEMLELIANDTGLQRAYRNNRIPVLEELLQRTAPENQPLPAMRADPQAEPTSTTDVRATLNFTEDSAHHGTPSADEREPASSEAVMRDAARYLREQQGTVDSASRSRRSSVSSPSRSASPAPSIPPGSANTALHRR